MPPRGDAAFENISGPEPGTFFGLNSKLFILLLQEGNIDKSYKKIRVRKYKNMNKIITKQGVV